MVCQPGQFAEPAINWVRTRNTEVRIRSQPSGWDYFYAKERIYIPPRRQGAKERSKTKNWNYPGLLALKVPDESGFSAVPLLGRCVRLPTHQTFWCGTSAGEDGLHYTIFCPKIKVFLKKFAAHATGRVECGTWRRDTDLRAFIGQKRGLSKISRFFLDN